MSRRKRLLPIRDVCTRHSGRMAIHGNSIVASGGRTPTMVAVPRMARLSMACRTSVALPTASNAWSTPAPFVSARQIIGVDVYDGQPDAAAAEHGDRLA